MAINQHNYGFYIERCGKTIKQRLQKLLIKWDAGVTVDQWVVLYELYQNQPMAQIEIAETTYKDPPSLTRIIDILFRKGLVARNVSAIDRRRVSLELTKSGKALIAKLLPKIKSFRTSGAEGLNEADLENLERILGTIEQNILKLE